MHVRQQAAQDSLDETREALIGNKLWDLYPGNAGASPEEGFNRAMAETDHLHVDLHDQTRHRCYAITAIPDSSDGILLRFSDATNPKNDESRKATTRQPVPTPRNCHEPSRLHLPVLYQR